MYQNMSGIDEVKHIVLVLSGKGGVGKSTVACQLATCLHLLDYKVGILDVDLCGPSIPRMLGIDGASVTQTELGWQPVPALADLTNSGDGLSAMSIGFLLPNNDAAVIWRGPKKSSMIKQFLNNVVWGPREYLIIDTPPGTSDEHMAVVESLREKSQLAGAILVTTPQMVSLGDVMKEYDFCLKLGVPVIGVIENMSGYVCPHCSDCSSLFSTGGGKSLAEHYNIPLLAEIPIEPEISSCLDTGECFFRKFDDSVAKSRFEDVAKTVIHHCSKLVNN